MSKKKRTKKDKKKKKGKKKEQVMVLVTYTPKMAEEILNNSAPNFRKVNSGAAHAFANDMIHGRWILTPQCISFDWDDELIDGQHRLHAVVISGKTITFWTCHGCDPTIAQYIDLHTRRSLTDRTNFIAKQHGLSTEKTQRKVAIIRAAFRGLGWSQANRKPTDLEFAYFVNFDYADVLAWILEHCDANHKPMSSAIIVAPIFRAWYHVKEDDLAEFCRGVAIGDELKRTDPTFLLRRWIMEIPIRQRDAREAYLKTERAIMAFLDGDELTKLFTAKEELFAFPPKK